MIKSSPKEIIYELLSGKCQSDQEFSEIFYKLQEAMNQEEMKEILSEVVSKKESGPLAEKIMMTLKKKGSKLAPIDQICHQLRKKNLEQPEISNLKHLIQTGQIYSFKATLQKLIGKQSEKFFKDYDKYLIEKKKQPLENCQIYIKTEKGLKFYKYSQPPLTSAEKANAKVLMVIGETGCGKSTFLNSLINYFSNIELNDPFRYQIIVENTKDQTKSITKEITSYFVRNLRNGKLYRLIDTPGFGDTQGHKSDQNLVKIIQKQFKTNIDVIDCVMFVVKFSTVRLNAYQKYIFQSVLNLFGKDVANNFCFILTFSDGGDPPVLQALKNKNQGFGIYWQQVPDPKYIPVNNGAFFQQVDLKDQIKTRYWQIGIQSMARLERRIDKCKPASMVLTKQMIKKKQTLSNQLRATRDKIDALTALQLNIKAEIQSISIYEKEINASKNFQYNYPELQIYHQKTQNNVTICNNCPNENCHDNCSYGNGESKKKCAAMDQDGNCTVCPSKCSFVAHTNDHYIRKKRTVYKTETNYGLKEKYQKSTQGFTTTQKAIVNKLKVLDRTFLETNQAYQLMFSLNQELDKISMGNKKSESFVEYLKIQIKNQQDFKPPGYQKKIKELELTLKQAELNASYVKGEVKISKQKLYQNLRQKRYTQILQKSSPSLWQTLRKTIGF